MRKVAVTGSLASGKSTVCAIFRELGAYTVSADEIAHQLLSRQDIHDGICRLTGLKGAVIDRKVLADIVFSDPKKLAQLEKLLHPEVFQEINKHYERVMATHACPLFVAEIPLFDALQACNYDAIICVTSARQQALERFLKRDPSSEKEFERRMQRQMSIPSQPYTYLVENTGSKQMLKKQVSELYSLLTSTRGSR